MKINDLLIIHALDTQRFADSEILMWGWFWLMPFPFIVADCVARFFPLLLAVMDFDFLAAGIEAFCWRICSLPR